MPCALMPLCTCALVHFFVFSFASPKNPADNITGLSKVDTIGPTVQIGFLPEKINRS